MAEHSPSIAIRYADFAATETARNVRACSRSNTSLSRIKVRPNAQCTPGCLRSAHTNFEESIPLFYKNNSCCAGERSGAVYSLPSSGQISQFTNLSLRAASPVCGPLFLSSYAVPALSCPLLIPDGTVLPAPAGPRVERRVQLRSPSTNVSILSDHASQL